MRIPSIQVSGRVVAAVVLVLATVCAPASRVFASGTSTISYKAHYITSSTTSPISLTLNVAQYDTVLVTFWASAIIASQPTAPTDSNGCVYSVAKTVGSLSTNYYGVTYVCASEPAANAADTVAVSFSSSNSVQWDARVYTGVNNTTPIDASGSATATGSGTTIPDQSVTTTRANDELVFFGEQYASFSGTFTAGSGFNNYFYNGFTFSSSEKNICSADQVITTISTTSSVTACNITGSSPFGYSGITLALATADCPSGYTGTYPNCVAPVTGGGTSTVTCTNCSNVDIHYIHQLAIKGFGFAVALATCLVLIYPFRYRERAG